MTTPRNVGTASRSGEILDIFNGEKYRAAESPPEGGGKDAGCLPGLLLIEDLAGPGWIITAELGNRLLEPSGANDPHQFCAAL